MLVLPTQTLSRTEEDLVAEALRSNPILIKYFRVLAHNIAADIACCPIEFEEAPETYIRKQHKLKGQLELLETLAQTHSAVQQS